MMFTQKKTFRKRWFLSNSWKNIPHRVCVRPKIKYEGRISKYVVARYQKEAVVAFSVANCKSQLLRDESLNLGLCSVTSTLCLHIENVVFLTKRNIWFRHYQLSEEQNIFTNMLVNGTKMAVGNTDRTLFYLRWRASWWDFVKQTPSSYYMLSWIVWAKFLKCQASIFVTAFRS